MTDCSSRWLRAWLLLIVAITHACANDLLKHTGVEAPADPPAQSDSGEAPPAPMDALPDPPDPVPARDAATPSQQADAAAPERPPPEPPRMSPTSIPDAAVPERAAEDAAAPERPEDAAAPERPAAPPRADDAWPADCDSREKFIAHGMSSRTDTSKYRLEPEAQHLATFIFSLPWGADSVQLLEARPVVDNAKVVHHWALYAGTAPTWLAGTVLVQPSSGATGDDPTDPKFVVGGGPGVGPIRLPDGVGMRVHRSDANGHGEWRRRDDLSFI